jgi:hypothetical protein
MAGERDPLAEADHNLVELWHHQVCGGPTPSAHVEPGLHLLASGIRGAPVNPAFVTETPADAAATLARIRHHYHDLGLPFSVFFRDEVAPTLASQCEAAGLVAQWSEPLMVLEPIPAEIEPPLPGLVIEHLDSANADAYAVTMARGFGFPEALARRLFGSSLLAIPGFTGLLGTIDGRPVATSAVFVTDGLAGIYNVATVPDQRGQGLGAALTAAAAHLGARADCSSAILQASAMGEPIYHRMGFTTTSRYWQFISLGG